MYRQKKKDYKNKSLFMYVGLGWGGVVGIRRGESRVFAGGEGGEITNYTSRAVLKVRKNQVSNQ